MFDDTTRRMAARDYDSCLDAATGARTADALARVRADVLHRWPDDLRARDLAETLHVYELMLATGDAHAAPTTHAARAAAAATDADLDDGLADVDAAA